MSKLQQESLIRKEGLQFGFDNKINVQKAFADVQRLDKEIWKCREKIAELYKERHQEWEQERQKQSRLLPRNVEQQNKSRLRRMWETVTQLFPNIHKSLLAERRLSEIANRQ